MSPTILVTGANGFVGRQVCQDLARCGYAVRGAVRDASRAAGLPSEIAVIGDIDGSTKWTAALSGVDTVIHLAARVHVVKERAADSLSTFRSVNVSGTEALACAATRHGVKRLVFMSSIKVNGESTGVAPFSAAHQSSPQDAYAVSKWEAEQSLWRIAGQTGLKVVIVRSPLVYGHGVGGNFLRLLKLIQRGIPLPFGSIDNRRSMIYGGNLAAALIACATHPAASGSTYLLSDGEDLSTPQLIDQLARLMGRPARLWRVPPRLLAFAGSLTGRSADVDRLIGSLQVDSSLIRAELDWNPPFTVSEGLAETARWFLQNCPQRGGPK